MVRKTVVESIKILAVALTGWALIATAPAGHLGSRAVLIMMLLSVSMLVRVLYLRRKS